MKTLINTSVLLLSSMMIGCQSTSSWVQESTTDEFTDITSCKVVYGSTIKRGFTKGLGGIHYYPFIEKSKDTIIFGISNDYNIPLGDVQIRVDNKSPILISYKDTPIINKGSSHDVNISYMKDIEGIDYQSLNESMKQGMDDIRKMSSPFTAVKDEKALKIIKLLKNGNTLKMRVLGYGVNSVASTTGTYKLDNSFHRSLSACGL